MPHGGKRAKAGRPRKLEDSVREAIAREYRQRMQAWAAAQQIGRDPNMIRRWEIEKKMERLAEKVPPPSSSQHERREDELYFYSRARHLFEPLQAELNSRLNQPNVAFPLKRAKGPRGRFIKELAEKYEVSPRTVVRCIDET
jgi:hypothetical protein